MDKKDYRYKKWTHLFHFLDLDQDGVLSFEEYMHFPIKLITSGEVEHGARMSLLHNTMWTKILQGAGIEVGQQEMDVNTFRIGHDFVSGLPWFKDEFVPGVISTFFDVVDTNHDGQISFVEWKKMYEKRGINDEAFVKSTFDKMDKNADGIISSAEFIYAFDMFSFNEDEIQDYSFLHDRRF